MKSRAFTLIELLVVIAIVAVLAAIMFPVFAQARIAAKKSAALSGQKQIGLAIQIYMGDYDDKYPRNDDCRPDGSLNPAHDGSDFPAGGVGPGCTAEPFRYRMNHYKWQVWVLPYTREVAIFEHPGRQKFEEPWSDVGEIYNSYALNLSLTGALNTYMAPPGRSGMIRNSWRGGTPHGVPDVAKAMLLMEFGNSNINFAPVVVDRAQSDRMTYTVYPPAVREWWMYNLLKPKRPCSNNWDWQGDLTNEPDERAAFGGGLALGFTDGHVQFYSVGRFLAETPTKAEYAVGGTWPAGRACGLSNGTLAWDLDVNLSLDYPMWALSR